MSLRRNDPRLICPICKKLMPYHCELGCDPCRASMNALSAHSEAEKEKRYRKERREKNRIERLKRRGWL
jgi:hypothetical protein